MNDYWLHLENDDLVNMSHVTAIRRLDDDEDGNVVIQVYFRNSELRSLTWRFKEWNGKSGAELDNLNPRDIVRGYVIPVQEL